MNNQTMIITAVVSFLAGVVVDRIVYNSLHTVGTLNIDKSDPEKDSYSFDVDDLDKLSTKKVIILKVNTTK